MRSPWESNKASFNLNKHGISFETACEAFFDPLFIVVDAGVVEGEQREVVIGMTVNWRLLFVMYVMVDDVVRIISARQVTASERRLYENQ